MFLDRHYLWRSHDPMSGIWSIFFKGLIVFHLPLYGVFCFCVFFLFASFLFLHLFLTSFFPIILWSNSDGLGSCTSCSDSLISLSYSMAVFSTKSFGLFNTPFTYYLLYSWHAWTIRQLNWYLNHEMLLFEFWYKYGNLPQVSANRHHKTRAKLHLSMA